MRVILKLIFKKWNEGMVGIEMALDRDRKQALANAVMCLQFPKNAVNFLIS